MTEFDDLAATFRVHLHENLTRLRRFARMLTGNQAWADQCVVQLLEDLLIEPRLFNLTSNPRVALYSRLLHILSVVPRESQLSNKLLVTPSPQQAQLLTAVEAFAKDEASEVLGVSPDQFDELLSDAQLALVNQRGARILIVEDEAFIALELEFLVTDLGHEYLDTATTRSEAVDKALLLKPDIILSDVQLLDGGSGIEAAQEIGETLDVRSIFITSSAERLLTGEQSEPVFIINKPFKRSIVQAVISQALFVRQSDACNSNELDDVIQC